jgi:hypothetical protein
MMAAMSLVEDSYVRHSGMLAVFGLYYDGQRGRLKGLWRVDMIYIFLHKYEVYDAKTML